MAGTTAAIAVVSFRCSRCSRYVADAGSNQFHTPAGVGGQYVPASARAAAAAPAPRAATVAAGARHRAGARTEQSGAPPAAGPAPGLPPTAWRAHAAAAGQPAATALGTAPGAAVSVPCALHRQLTLSDGLDVEAISASYAHGVLTLRIPVAEAAKPRKIAVQTADAPAVAGAEQAAEVESGAEATPVA